MLHDTRSCGSLNYWKFEVPFKLSNIDWCETRRLIVGNEESLLDKTHYYIFHLSPICVTSPRPELYHVVDVNYDRTCLDFIHFNYPHHSTNAHLKIFLCPDNFSSSISLQDAFLRINLSKVEPEVVL
jgi:hypothetical protein